MLWCSASAFVRRLVFGVLKGIIELEAYMTCYVVTPIKLYPRTPGARGIFEHHDRWLIRRVCYRLNQIFCLIPEDIETGV